MPDRLDTCALCPRLCRHACPVAAGTSREAAVPAQIAGVLLRWQRGELPDDLALSAATLCVDCGACQDVCHLHRPLPEALRQARAQLEAAPTVEPLGPIEGEGTWVAVETDDRPWAEALSARAGHAVARLRTKDALGLALRGHPAWNERRDLLATVLAGRTVIVAHGGVAAALAEAGITVAWLHDVVLDLGPVTPSCACGGPQASCCGGAGPLAAHHPDDAVRMAHRWHRAGAVADARCAAHLASVGLTAVDAVDRLLETR